MSFKHNKKLANEAKKKIKSLEILCSRLSFSGLDDAISLSLGASQQTVKLETSCRFPKGQCH
jgi:hypothetical protein